MLHDSKDACNFISNALPSFEHNDLLKINDHGTNAAQLGDFRLHYATPHLDAFIDNMERLAARETDIVHFFECINSAFMYGNVPFVDSTNEKTQNRVPWPWKFENFLRVTQEKRAAHFVTLAAGSARDRLRARDENLIFEDNDMKMIMNN